jgi:uncharacterized hydrophobic protein (TIGR00271 family)
MIHLRIVAPPELAGPTLALLERLEIVTALVHVPGAARRPAGDLITCDVPREAGSQLIDELRALGLGEGGSLAIDTVEAAVSDDAARAARLAPGLGSDAMVGEVLESRTAASAELSAAFLVYMAVATLLSAIGVLIDSLVLVIGAMVVGPEFGPLAGVCVGLIYRRPDLAGRSLVALAVGFPLGIAAAVGLTWLLQATGVAPAALEASHHQATLFISRPDVYAAIVAALAGVAGMVSLTTGSAGTLIGVLISVTTIPAAGNLGDAIAYGDVVEARGSAAQLSINLAVIVVAGLAALRLQRAAFLRRLPLLRGRRR